MDALSSSLVGRARCIVTRTVLGMEASGWSYSRSGKRPFSYRSVVGRIRCSSTTPSPANRTTTGNDIAVVRTGRSGPKWLATALGRRIGHWLSFSPLVDATSAQGYPLRLSNEEPYDRERCDSHSALWRLPVAYCSIRQFIPVRRGSDQGLCGYAVRAICESAWIVKLVSVCVIVSFNLLARHARMMTEFPHPTHRYTR